MTIVDGETKILPSSLGDRSKAQSTLLYRVGLSLARKGNMHAAESANRRVLAIDPDHAGAHVQLAAALTGQNRLNEAAEILRTAAQARPHEANLHYRLGLVLARLNDHAGAEAAYARTIERDPGHAGAPLQRVTALERMGRLAEAAEILRTAAQARPHEANLHYRLGLVLARLNDHAGAEAAYARAIERDPDHAGAPLQRITALERMGRLAEAADQLRAVTQARPDDTGLHYRLGLVLTRLDEHVGAEKAYARVLELDPGHGGAPLQRAMALERIGRLDEAVVLLRAVTQVRPDDVGLHYRLGLMLARLGDHAGTEAAYARVLELDPGHATAPSQRSAALDRTSRRALALERKGRLTEAADMLRAIALARPDDSESHYRLGTVLARLGDHAGAEASYARVIELDPDHVAAPLQRAAALERAGRLAEATDLLRIIAQAKLHDVGVHYRLGLVLERLKDHIGAEAAYAHVLELDPGHAGAPSKRAAALDRMDGLAAALEQKGRFAAAADLLRIITQARPTDVGIHYRLGSVLTQLGDYTGAEVAYRRVLAIDEESSTVSRRPMASTQES